MTIFTVHRNAYCEDQPGSPREEDQVQSHVIVQSSFETPGRAIQALSQFVNTVQRRGNQEPNAAIQRLFDQEVNHLISGGAPAQEVSTTGMGEMPWDILVHISQFLDLRSQGRVAQTCQDWVSAIQQRHLFDMSIVRDPEMRPFLPLLGFNSPPSLSSSREVGDVYRFLLVRVKTILDVVQTSPLLSDDERSAFRNIQPQDIIQRPKRLHGLLKTAYDHSLVSPFTNGRNNGPDLGENTSLAEKAQRIRRHLEQHMPSYTSLYCKALFMLCFPKELCCLKNLQQLELSANPLTAVPVEIGQLSQLERLYLIHNQITTLPAEIGQLSQLQMLNLYASHLTAVPAEIGQLSQLRRLYLSHGQLTALPEEIGQMSQLELLDLSYNQLTALPEEIGQMSQLQRLVLNHNPLTTVPAELWDVFRNPQGS